MLFYPEPKDGFHSPVEKEDHILAGEAIEADSVSPSPHKNFSSVGSIGSVGSQNSLLSNGSAGPSSLNQYRLDSDGNGGPPMLPDCLPSVTDLFPAMASHNSARSNGSNGNYPGPSAWSPASFGNNRQI